ncbi:MAG: Uma2 family endonuclease [Gammaproteobacteria bacterium]|nr:Uma2 family endonuclease [Gammaproteobacteria bacterium]
MSVAPTALAEVPDDICSLPLMDVPCRLPGKWDDEAYLTLAESVRRLVEMTDGVVEVLPPPTIDHQHMLGWLFEAFRRHIADAGGMVVFSPVPLRIRERNYREPDLIFWRNANDPRLEGTYLDGADLVVEVVSPSGAKRDLVDKRLDYAEAAIPEYWIVDPRYETVTVLTLAGGEYAEAGVFARGTDAVSSFVPDLRASVDDLFDAPSGY